MSAISTINRSLMRWLMARAELFSFGRQVRIDARGGGRVVAELYLNEPKIDAGLQQMRGPGMPQRMHRRRLWMPLSLRAARKAPCTLLLGMVRWPSPRRVAHDPLQEKIRTGCDV